MHENVNYLHDFYKIKFIYNRQTSYLINLSEKQQKAK
jgi:hypothetical protein